MATLGLNRDEVYRDLALILGVNRDPSTWAADTNLLSDVERVWRSGRRKFLTAHDWHFLQQELDPPIVTSAPFSETTVTVVDGVVTKTGGTAFPAAVVAEYLLSLGGSIYKVATRTSDDIIALHDTSVQADAGTEYNLYRYRHPLPANFATFRGPLVTENNEAVSESAVFPDYEYNAFTNQNSVRTGRPTLFAVSQVITDEAIGTLQFYLNLYPLPDDVFVITGRIGINIEDTLDELDTTEVVPPQFAECAKEAILSAAELMIHGKRGAHSEEYERQLEKAILIDKRTRGIRHLIPKDYAHRSPGYEYRHADVDWTSAEI